MKELTIHTEAARQVVDITDQVSQQLETEDGVVHIFAKHTTVAISVADLDPGTDQDYLNALFDMVPDIDFNHPHDPAHTPSHILSAMIKPELTVPVVAGRLQLGTWQRIVLLEFDGPRERHVVLSFL